MGIGEKRPAECNEPLFECLKYGEGRGDKDSARGKKGKGRTDGKSQ